MSRNSFSSVWGSTGHTGFLAELVKEVLEGNGCQRLALSAHSRALLPRLPDAETIGITAARHDTSGELIDDQNLVVFYHVVLIAEHQVSWHAVPG